MKIHGFSWNPKTGVGRFEVVIPGTGGRRRRRKTQRGLPTRDQALKAWRKFREAALAGRVEERHTFASYVTRYWPTMQIRLRPSSVATMQHALDSWLLPRLGPLALDRVNAAELRDLATEMHAAGRSPYTINNVIAVALRFLRDAVDRDVIPKLPRVQRQKTEILKLELTPDERVALLKVFENAESTWEGQRLREIGPLFVLALETGLRRGDLLELRWESVDMSSGWIRVTTRKKGTPAVVPVSARCRAALEDLRDRPAVITGHICVDPDGRVYSRQQMTDAFQLAKGRAGITRRLRIHDIRHTFASDLVSSGVPEPYIRKALGHSGTQSLMRYAKPREESLRAIADALDGREGRRDLNSNLNSSARRR